MAGMFALFLFGQMYYMPYVLKGARDGMLHPKNKKLNKKILFIISMLLPNIFYFMMGAGGYLELSKWLRDGSVVFVFFTYAVVNMIVQVIFIKREDCRIDVATCNCCKVIWFVGMVVHSLIIIVALLNQQNVVLWMTGAAIFYGIYNYGFLFFIYFTEKEIMSMAWGEKESLTSKAIYIERLRPLNWVTNEEYRQRIMNEVNWIVGIGSIFSCSLCLFGVFAMIMWYCNSNGNIWKLFGAVPFLIALGVSLRFFIKKDRAARKIQFESIYEGGAQVVTPIPLTVRYRKPDGTLVARQATVKTKKIISVGTFVKVVVENDRDVKIIVENGEAAKIVPGDEQYFSACFNEISGRNIEKESTRYDSPIKGKATEESMFEKKLMPLKKVDGEEYRKYKIKRIRRKCGGALLGFCLIAGGVTAVILVISERQALLFPLGLFCLGMLFVGAGIFSYYWRMEKKKAETMQFDKVYEGVAQVFHTNPLIVKFFLEDEQEATKRVNIQIRCAIPIGTFVRIVLENGEVVKIMMNDGK